MENMRMGAGIAAPNLVNICVDESVEGGLAGRIYHSYAKEPGRFNNIVQLLRFMETFYNQISFPQAAVSLRKFVKNNWETPQKPTEEKMARDMVLEQRGACATFLVYVQYRQNATWQGRLTWMEREKSLEFRSALEMIMLIDNALTRGHRE